MARFVLFTLYYLLLAPVVWMALSWWLIAYRAEPNSALFAVLMGTVLFAPIVFLLWARRGKQAGPRIKSGVTAN